MADLPFASFARQCAMLATGRLEWAPEVFWGCTYAEFRLALDGRFGPVSGHKPLSSAELAKLKEHDPDD